jgi:glutamate-ammonia-ligase adenylyltransferase
MKHPHLLDELLLVDHQKFSEQDEDFYWQEWQNALEEKIHFILHNEQDEEEVWNSLRQMHQSEIFQILLADLGGFNTAKLTLEKISDRLSKLADIIITVTLNFVWDRLKSKFSLTKALNESGFAVIAYGKLGGKELGYGSDLDLVFIYDETYSEIPEQDIQQVFATLVRKFILAITTSTRAGVLYDIDTRLRPNGVSGLLVSNLTSYENYQKNIGSNTAWVWEHQALTRARFCSGDTRVGRKFEAIRAEVLLLERNCLSLAKEVCLMREKLLQNHPSVNSRFDIKHNRGGMIDIEFMIQYLVLCRAHQFPELIENIGNIALLHVCAQHGLISERQANEVAGAYRLFRKLQHQIRLDSSSNAKLENHLLTPEVEAARSAVLQLWQALLDLK